MNLRFAKTRLIGRWGVWVCTGLVLILIPVSVWAASGVGFQLAKSGQPYYPHRVDVGVSRYRVVVQYYSSYRLHEGFSSGDPLISGATVEWMDYRPFPPVISEWWAFPSYSTGGGSSGPMKRFEISLVYPSLLMVGWSLWLVRGVRRRRFVEGCCVECGYCLEGLGGGVCPECGEG